MATTESWSNRSATNADNRQMLDTSTEVITPKKCARGSKNSVMQRLLLQLCPGKSVLRGQLQDPSRVACAHFLGGSCLSFGEMP
jgi:hypothetical protein